MSVRQCDYTWTDNMKSYMRGFFKSAYFVCFVQDTNQRTRFEVVEHFVPFVINNRVPRRKVESSVILLSVITCAFVT